MFGKLLDKLKSFDKKIWLYGGIGILLIIVLVFFIGIFFDEKTDGERFAYEYESLNDKKNSDGNLYPFVNISSDNVMKYVDADKIIDTFRNKEDAVVYFGYPSCLYCRSAISVLLDAASKKKLNFIYYLDIEEQGEHLNTLYKLLGSELVSDDGVIEAPLVIFIVNGEISGYNKGTLFSQESPYVSLDKYQTKGLRGIYESGMNDVLDSLGNKKMNLSNK